ncbi:putative tRNA 2'-phosphotransferase [Umbelopsis sp. AD052]|nr:putative tRNA 2'-phosphotransferase [Umbelopsis sp. AD052]
MSEDVVIPRLDDRQKIQLSKALSYILRHGANKEKLDMTDDGFIKVQEILNRPKLKTYTFEDIKYVVDTNDKQRFNLKQDEDGCWWIRANQGHSLKTVKVELDLVKEPLPICVHGTYTTNWNSIATQGLKRMSRNHIHFAAGMPGENGVISGMRKSCDVFIYVDMARAMEDGIVFQLSANQVILSEGINGVLDPAYFSKVVDKEGKPLMTHPSIVT